MSKADKKIRIIDLLNKIANGEEVPRKIIFLNEILEYDIDSQDYKGFSKTGSGAFFGCLFTNEPTQNFINDRVEILEDNTEEIEEIDNWFVDERKECREFDIQAINLCFSKHRDKINELVKAINEIRKDKNND